MLLDAAAYSTQTDICSGTATTPNKGMETPLTRRSVHAQYDPQVLSEIYGDAVIEYDGEDEHMINELLRRVVVKPNVATIRDFAFEDCKILQWIKLCDGLREIGNSLFKGCNLLEKIEINTNLESIGSAAFEGCSSATELIIPKRNLKSIGNGAFVACYKINRVEIADNVKKIGNRAFMNCTGLREVILPDLSKRSALDYSCNALNCKIYRYPIMLKQ